MKHKGCKNEYEQERNMELMKSYKELIYNANVIRTNEIFEKLVDMPCSRFWVSEYRAAIVISRMINGDKLEGMRKNTREMYEEIYKRVCKLREVHPNMTCFLLAFNVVNQPAPKFYLTPKSAKVIVLDVKRRLRGSKLTL